MGDSRGAVKNSWAAGVPVDAHVHFHRVEYVGPTLDAAAENFAVCRSAGAPLSGVLLLVESARERVFAQLQEMDTIDAWSVQAVPGELQTIMASSASARIAIVCGRQIRCADGLEVLALGTLKEYSDGVPLGATIDLVLGDGAVAVIPWGFGKWTGRRGRLVEEEFRSRDPATLFAGDNGGRMQILGRPKLLQFARDAGFRMLPGSDPFPFSGDYRRVGSFGFLAGNCPDMARPWASLRGWLAGYPDSPEPYGRALSPLRFGFNQGWIQVHNRMLDRSAR